MKRRLTPEVRFCLCGVKAQLPASPAGRQEFDRLWKRDHPEGAKHRLLTRREYVQLNRRSGKWP